MTDQQTIEGEAQELEVRHTPSPRGEVALAVTPAVSADELVGRLAVIRDAAQKAMMEDVDYGKVPGTNKDTLFKPGAEKLAVLFQLDIQFDSERLFVDDHLTVISKATVYHAPTGQRLGYGEGVCSTKEKKYATRKQERVCPVCGAAAVIKGKEEYGGGWLCWKKRDGCGAKFEDGDDSIEGQEAGEIENPDLPDLWNTVTKMAKKRALVDAVLIVTGASALFTQDMEEETTGAAPTAAAPTYGPPANDKTAKRATQALTMLVTDDETDKETGPAVAAAVLEQIHKDADAEQLPAIVARAFLHAGAALKKAREAGASAPEAKEDGDG